ncbi:type IX secretion system membrane protein PorP/SprF [Cellulophaga sp. HaHaR_3_176]|uniref:PorP/SprF family type IX secretion system membrane protein n=1 Tax=Cellulophaga sp. HaHaR_3_176 TaxID=1942464 RepID=UPI001C1F4863|nr:type IX secretion system membrane protein PorP/SprF [Cellulophaga sp. HaHaR_3_176]QWX83632.1 type IX secretion system membrane protein PorP/SprF [Cellulophaga sp. HaHaR_3_176]
MLKRNLIYIFICLLALTRLSAQEEDPYLTYDVPSQNLLKFNRFLINPTFSTVREDKSYFNLLHRNQSSTFQDNNQTYFLSYSGRMNDRTGLGLSLYSQQSGVLTNYGVLANYAYGVKLSDKSNFTFGANVSYYRTGLDRTRTSTVEGEDPFLNGLQDSNLLSFQPGFNLSYGKFDFGVFAENLFDYNLRTNESITEFGDKTFSTHLQYTHQFENGIGVMEGARLMPLLRVKKAGQKYRVADKDLILGGSLVLDLPKLGWVQGGYDTYYGAAAGVGFNLSKRLSLGYTMEKGLSNNFDNFGVTHEISFAYSITPNLTEDRVLLEDSDELVKNNDLLEDTEELTLTSKDEEIESLRKALTENNEVIAELMFRQDSIEASRNGDLERRFEMVMQMVRRETNGKKPTVEERAKKMYLLNNVIDKDATEVASNTPKTSETQNITNNKEPLNLDNKKPISIKNTDDALVITNTRPTSVTKKVNTPTEKKVDAFTQIAKKNNVKSRKFTNLEGVNDGFYIVANVYKNTHYMNKFIDDLRDKGIEADYFENKNNGLKYVYLKQHNSWNDALSSYKSKADSNYSGEMWIMNVDNSNYSDSAYANNSQKIREKASKYNVENLKKSSAVQDNLATTNPTVKNYKFNGVGGGYYIIANVFASAKNANNFVKVLNAQGLNASYFINPENNYRYVYLKKHGSWNNALISYYSKINNSYDQKMWIMRITPSLVT